ncbi:hypothetical protein HGRIS_006055 [Hohenbuehelia grisea]|uniref:SHSP domain-containing protein n=1 Tax=Hohenbuehelia grisea TaxID=104357 RepID=A0ABR3JZW0_9AGAR
MSHIARNLLHEFRPLFRMLEEPLSRSPSYFGLPSRSLLDDPFFRNSALSRPAVDVSEEGNVYVVEADLPGVKKENVEVRIGDGGRSLTIEGRILSRRSADAATNTAPQEIIANDQSGSSNDASTAPTAVAQADSSNQLSTERMFSGSSTFTRTVWLPRPVDTNKVSAALNDGILTIRVQKAEDKASVSIPIN